MGHDPCPRDRGPRDQEPLHLLARLQTSTCLVGCCSQQLHRSWHCDTSDHPAWFSIIVTGCGAAASASSACTGRLLGPRLVPWGPWVPGGPSWCIEAKSQNGNCSSTSSSLLVPSLSHAMNLRQEPGILFTCILSIHDE